MIFLPKSLTEIDKLHGKKGIKKGLEWIYEYHIILNNRNKHETVNWYIPSDNDGIVAIKKRLIFLFELYKKLEKKNTIPIPKSEITLEPSSDNYYMMYQKQKYLNKILKKNLESSYQKMEDIIYELEIERKSKKEKELEFYILNNKYRKLTKNIMI